MPRVTHQGRCWTEDSNFLPFCEYVALPILSRLEVRASQKSPPQAVTEPQKKSPCFSPNCPNPSIYWLPRPCQCPWAPCRLAGAAKWRVLSGQQRSLSTAGVLLGHSGLSPWRLDSYKPLQVSVNPPWLQLQCPPRCSLPTGDRCTHGPSPSSPLSASEWECGPKWSSPPPPLAPDPLSWSKQTQTSQLGGPGENPALPPSSWPQFPHLSKES